MIIEQRTYDFHPGTLPRFFQLYEETGARALQMQVLGQLVGYFVTELGPLNQTVHLWAYASLDDRAARRAALMEEEKWRSFLKEILPLLQRQESKILLPQSFSPTPAVA